MNVAGCSCLEDDTRHAFGKISSPKSWVEAVFRNVFIFLLSQRPYVSVFFPMCSHLYSTLQHTYVHTREILSTKSEEACSSSSKQVKLDVYFSPCILYFAFPVTTPPQRRK